MELARAIMQMYPNAEPMVDFTVRNDSNGLGDYIETWNILDPQPTQEQLNTAWFQYLQASKIADIKDKCRNTIYAGFSANSTGHFYTMDDQDQGNMTQKMLLIVHDTGNTITSFNVKTRDAGIVIHTRDDFLNVCLEAGNFKETNMNKCWDLMKQVNTAQTPGDLKSIEWY